MVVEGGRSGEVVRAVGCDEPLTSAQFPLTTYPALASVTSRHAIASFDLPAAAPPDGSRVPVLDSLASAPAAISIPLVTAGRAIAILVVSFREARNFLPDEREFLLSAGRRTAEAYVRAQAYETAERARARDGLQPRDFARCRNQDESGSLPRTLRPSPILPRRPSGRP